MAWTTPRSWVAGEVLTAAQLNEQLRDNLSFLANMGEIGFASRATAATTSGTTELTVLTASSVAFAGGRRVKLAVHIWDHLFTASGDLYFLRLKDGGTTVNASALQTLTGHRHGLEFSHVYTPAAGTRDITLTAQRSTGTGTLTLAGAASLELFLSVEDIGPA